MSLRANHGRSGRSRSRSRTEPAYAEAYPSYAQSYDTQSPDNYVQREVRPTAQAYETKAPRNHAQREVRPNPQLYDTRGPRNSDQYLERAPSGASGTYAIRNRTQYQTQQPTGAFVSSATSLPRDIRYDVKSPTGVITPERPKDRPRLAAYVESVVGSDEESDIDDQRLPQHSSARPVTDREPRSPDSVTSPTSPNIDEGLPLSRSPVKEMTSSERHTLSDIQSRKRPVQPQSDSSPDRESKRENVQNNKSSGRPHPIGRASSGSVHNFPASSSQSPHAQQAALNAPHQASPQSPVTTSSYSNNTYQEVRPAADLRRYSSHRRDFEPISPRSPQTPWSPQSPVSPATDHPRAMNASAGSDAVAERYRKPSSAIGSPIESCFTDIGPSPSAARAESAEVISLEKPRRRPSLRVSSKAKHSHISEPIIDRPAQQGGLLAVAGTPPIRRRSTSRSVRPPASPLLETYRGTYQNISPMPSPIVHATDLGEIDDLPPLSPSTSTTISEASSRLSRSRNKVIVQTKHATIYDASADADTLLSALNYSNGVKSGPLVAILPSLTHDQMLEIRSEYKRRYRIGGHGVNIAKHIKSKTTGNFGKSCYVVALGRWESEAYWANFWYQSHNAGRELLIEALMGRSNAEIRLIKQGFKDKRYNDSLVRCMEKEVKADKFRKAVLMALEENRQEETELLPLETRERDVEALHMALLSKEGGESAIIAIVIGRSDAHLREVLKAYEIVYGTNFAREALKKSNNLVGELLAHVLNGIINRPLRDALLLNHAIADVSSHNSAVQLRHELLISRLVRIHWDRAHLIRVREEYAKRYGDGVSTALERDVGNACKGDYGLFCVRLCEV